MIFVHRICYCDRFLNRCRGRCRCRWFSCYRDYNAILSLASLLILWTMVDCGSLAVGLVCHILISNIQYRNLFIPKTIDIEYWMKAIHGRMKIEDCQPYTFIADWHAKWWTTATMNRFNDSDTNVFSSRVLSPGMKINNFVVKAIFVSA